jgi:hypothetical protein
MLLCIWLSADAGTWIATDHWSNLKGPFLLATSEESHYFSDSQSSVTPGMSNGGIWMLLLRQTLYVKVV